MSINELLQKLGPKEQRGSKPRCHLLTHGDRATVAARLTAMLEPHGRVDAGHLWLPDGFATVTEPKLGETPGLLSAAHREIVTDWWLAVRPNANTPNWDIAGTCDVGGRPGLFLVEAKAHLNELKVAGKTPGSTENGKKNDERIGLAIADANAALHHIGGSWGLSRDSHYQLANRFAWSWKVASLGVPVILVYLGFLNADEMRDQGPPIVSDSEWEKHVCKHSNGIVPVAAWNQEASVCGTSMRALTRSTTVKIAEGEDAAS